MRARVRQERGATVVEAAFALPILFFFIFGLLDLGMWTFNSNQAANAAKDGARAAIVQHRAACDEDGDGVVEDEEWCGVDEPHSTAWNRAIGRIEGRLDRDLDETDVSIRCETPDGTSVACKAATVDVDRVRVAVDWTWDLLTPVAGAIGVDQGAATGAATMTIIGKPVGTPHTVPPDEEPPPPEPPADPEPVVDCTISSVKIGKTAGSNGTIQVKSNRQLIDSIYVTFTTNGADRCNGLAVQLRAPDGTLRSASCMSCTTSSQQWVFDDKNDKIWDPGTGQSRIYNEWVPGVVSTFTLVQ